MPQMLSADSSRATEKIVCGLSLKTAQNGTIYMKNSVGVSGVQNCEAGCLPVAVPGSYRGLLARSAPTAN